MNLTDQESALLDTAVERLDEYDADQANALKEFQLYLPACEARRVLRSQFRVLRASAEALTTVAEDSGTIALARDLRRFGDTLDFEPESSPDELLMAEAGWHGPRSGGTWTGD